MIGKPWPMYPTRSPSRPLNVSRRCRATHQPTYSTECTLHHGNQAYCTKEI